MSEPATRTRSAPRGPRRTVPAILLALTLAGAVWRLAAFFFNVWPHGDVILDAGVAEALATRGALLVPIVDVRYYPIDRFGFGYPMDQHPPLWPLLGAPLVRLVANGYEALKLLSLLVGVALVPLAYLTCRPLIGGGPALLAAGLAAVSYPLVDFSGNGSLWILLAAFYLLFVWRVGGWGLDDRRNAILVGLLMGLAYLTNYPAVTLPTSLALLHLLRWGRTALRREALAGPVLSLAVMLAVVAPWLIHNWAVFGNPFWSQPLERSLAGGSRQVEYVVVGDEVLKRNLPPPDGWAARLRERAVDLYGNVGFTARQLAVLAFLPMAFFVVGVGSLVMGTVGQGRGARGRCDPTFECHPAVGCHPAPIPWPLAPLIVLALVHLTLVLLWPTTKFRYLVPLLPLIFAIGSWSLWQAKAPARRGILAAATVGLCLVTNLWTFAAIPSHTYYYNGGLVRDNFGGQGETAFVEEARHVRAAGDAIAARGPGPVLGDHILHAFTHHPLIVNSTAYPPDIVAHLVRKYGIRYVVAERARAGSYSFLGPTELWSDDRWIVLELP